MRIFKFKYYRQNIKESRNKKNNYRRIFNNLRLSTSHGEKNDAKLINIANESLI